MINYMILSSSFYFPYELITFFIVLPVYVNIYNPYYIYLLFIKVITAEWYNCYLESHCSIVKLL